MIFYDDINSISQIFCGKWLIFAIVFAALNALVLVPLARKFLQIMQQSSYRNDEYNVWLRRKPNVYKIRLVVLSLLSVFSNALFVVAFAFLETSWSVFAAFAFYVLFIAIYAWGDRKHGDKCPLKLTKRLLRLYVCNFLTMTVLSLAFIFAINALFFLFKDAKLLVRARFCLVCLLPIAIPFAVKLSNVIIKPLEKSVSAKYIKNCKKKLSSFDGLIKIGITGSYGKTTVKNILQTILGVKYKVYATPKSFNTPMGICKSVGELDGTFDVFIAEMGARRRGDIKELCEIVKPTYGILTGITNQHLETFGSLEQIKNTKAELMSSLDGGACVLCGDSEETLSLKNKPTKAEIIIAGTSENADVFAQDISLSKNGSSFTLNLFGEKIEVKTKLLGLHNVSNICLAAALSSKIGLKKEEIAEGISLLKTPPHRLELVENDKGITILDDTYNANVKGTQAALDVAKSFGGRQIVVTPGLVELGSRQVAENREFGKRLSVCDTVVLVGSNSAYDVREGLLSAGFDFDKIIMAKTLDDAKEKLSSILNVGDVVLFENDLPDKFL